jgi:hypothetical protein
MVLQTWSQVIGESFQSIWLGVMSFVPGLVMALIVFMIGWIVASLLEKVISQAVKALMVDKALRSAGVEEVLAKGGLHLNAGAFLGGLVRWFVIVVFLVASLEVIGLTQVTIFLRDVVLGYLPQVIVAALVLLVGAVLADVMDRVVTSSARAADMQSAGFLGGVSRWSIWLFALIIALSHLGIAPQFMYTLFTGVVAMLALAGGLAFGLGGKDAAARFVERLREDISNKK